jgi:hypothetical protein
MIAVNWPRGNPMVTPSSARTALSPRPYTLVASIVAAAMSTDTIGSAVTKLIAASSVQFEVGQLRPSAIVLRDRVEN